MYHFSESSGTHRRLMAQLGLMTKSQSHAQTLAASLKAGGNDSHAVPCDPKGFVRKASPDALLTPTQRAADAAREKAAEAEYERRRKAMQAGTNGSVVSDEDDEEEDEEMVDGVPMSGSSLSKSMHKGSFQRLRTSLHTFMKAQSSDHTDDFATRYGMPTAHVTQVAGRSAVAKPTIVALTKSIEATRQRVQTTLGVSPMRNLNQKMQSIARRLGNEQLAKSMGGGNLGGLRSAAPQYSVPQVEAAAGAALAHGAIDAQSAQVIANSLALGGIGAVPSALMAKLRGE